MQRVWRSFLVGFSFVGALSASELPFRVLYTTNPTTHLVEAFVQLPPMEETSVGIKRRFVFRDKNDQVLAPVYVGGKSKETILFLGPVEGSQALDEAIVRSIDLDSGESFANKFSFSSYLESNTRGRQIYETEMEFQVLADPHSVKISLRNNGIGEMRDPYIELVDPETKAHTKQPMQREGRQFIANLMHLKLNQEYVYIIYYYGLSGIQGDETLSEKRFHQISSLLSRFHFQLGAGGFLPEDRILEDLQKMQRTKEKTFTRKERVQLKQFRKQGNQVVVSLTTSPLRLRYIPYVLRVVDLTFVDKIFLVLPIRYGRDQSEYDATLVKRIQLALEHEYGDRIAILRPTTDLGPISKILPTAKYLLSAQSVTPRSILISLDDDISYEPDTVNHLAALESLSKNENSVISGSGQDVMHWNTSPFGWPKKLADCQEESEEADPLAACDIVEGFAGIAYRLSHFINWPKLEAWSQSSPYCRLSDDWVLSYFLAQEGIKRYRVTEHSPASEVLWGLNELPFGLRGDALHLGGGLPSQKSLIRNQLEASWAFMSQEVVNYQRCHDALVQIHYHDAFQQFRRMPPSYQ